MWENKLNNFNIDLLAKDSKSFSKSHKTIKVEFIRIESNLDFKKIRSSSTSQVSGRVMGVTSSLSAQLVAQPSGGNTLLNLKRNRYKLMRLFGQSPQFIQAKKSVAEWQLRKDMPIGNLVTLRGHSSTGTQALDRFYKLLFLIGIPRDSKLLVSSIKQNKVPFGQNGKKFGLNELNSESIIIENDWTMSNFIENSWNKSIAIDLDKQMNEVRELKLLNIGMSINIKFNSSSFESKSEKLNTAKKNNASSGQGSSLAPKGALQQSPYRDDVDYATTRNSKTRSLDLSEGNSLRYNNWLISYLPMYLKRYHSLMVKTLSLINWV